VYATSDHSGASTSAGSNTITTAMSAAPNNPSWPSATSNERLPGGTTID
jgi:hypothetical protein